jgi:hypothetical protein
MRYRLQTLLIAITFLAIGFGAGIAVEKWRDAKEQSRIALEESRLAVLRQNAAPPVVITKGMRYSDYIKARGMASMKRRAAKAAQGTMPNP